MDLLVLGIRGLVEISVEKLDIVRELDAILRKGISLASVLDDERTY